MSSSTRSPADDPPEEYLLPQRIYLIDRSQSLVGRWQQHFADCPKVEAVAGDYFQRPADALVSPANSYGIMDGGLDLAIRDQLGFAVQERIQAVIIDKYHGEMPVGSAEVVRTDDNRWRYLVAAPTMRVPEPVPFTINDYLAFRAILIAIENVNRAAGRREIDSVVCCGLGTGVGKMDANKCAMQMRAAYQLMKAPSRIPSFQSIHEFHRALMQM
ncbi:macro domain-containing protein [Fimbriiglobus ruber]|uniref:Phage tail assembly-like protein n=1 Tax=Fimbriiglobus ruber TaxID=1908690 RepID=A0A225DSM6_9BACT|nr:macro domain-containing protein [Fimbriiglobus ruber]OWK39087.1 phage tail assembly-like protein [Fimbriiglobus ruber]